MKYLEQLFPRAAVPALLLGLSTNAFQDLASGPVGIWIGRVALGLFFASALVYLTFLGFNRIVPRRFANLVYLFDDAMNVAVIDHPFHKRIQPPGSRLGYHEAPHEAVRRVLKEELGLGSDKITFVPNDRQEIGKVTFVPPPVRVQVERRKQRIGVTEHYDFVYLCLIPGVRPEVRSPLNPRWMSLDELRAFASTEVESAPFGDVIPSVERLIPIATKSRKVLV